jgi:hypothetical protein
VSQYICVWFAFAFLLHAVPSPRDVENVELRADRLPAPLRPVVRIGTSLLGPVQTVILVAQIGILQGIGLLVFEISVETSTLVSMAGFYLGGALGIIVLLYGYDLIRGRRRIRDDIARFRSADMRRATRLRDRAERGPDAAVEALPEIVALLSSDSTPVQIGAVQALVSAVESDPIAVATYDDDIATVIETGSDERVLRLLLITVEALAEELVERDGETEAEKTGTTLSPVLVDAVVRSLAVEQPEVRTAAARALSKIDRTEGADISDAVPALLACARMEDASDNNRAFAALSGVAGQRPDLLRQHEEWVTARLESEDVLDRVSAIGILGGTFAIDALDRLRKVKADDEEPPVRLVADQMIHRLDPLREAVDRIRSAADGGPGTDSTGGG